MLHTYVIVTRHSALVEYLRGMGYHGKVIAHATADDVRDKHIIGVLPLRLAALAASVTEVPLYLPQELRGKELTLDQVRQYAGSPIVYKVYGWVKD